MKSLCQEQKYKELENLAGSLMDVHESPQAWIAYALLAKCHKRHDQAFYFIHKVRLFFYSLRYEFDLKAVTDRNDNCKFLGHIRKLTSVN